MTVSGSSNALRVNAVGRAGIERQRQPVHVAPVIFTLVGNFAVAARNVRIAVGAEVGEIRVVVAGGGAVAVAIGVIRIMAFGPVTVDRLDKNERAELRQARAGAIRLRAVNTILNRPRVGSGQSRFERNSAAEGLDMRVTIVEI